MTARRRARRKRRSKNASTQPILCESVDLGEHASGEQWKVRNSADLARLIALVAMGQASHAAEIVRRLLPAAPAFSNSRLCEEAIVRLSVQEDGKAKRRKGYPRVQRDGFVFEVISWVAARQNPSAEVLIRDPHVSSTSQGLDGLMLELDSARLEVKRTTLFEDKCTKRPRRVFKDDVLPYFQERHKNERMADVVAAASALLRAAGLDGTRATTMAASVLDLSIRRYRAAFILSTSYADPAKLRQIFKNYELLEDLEAEQRIGAGLVATGDVRDWIENLASDAISFLRATAEGESNV